MGILQKIKDIFGIGGVKIQIEAPKELNKDNDLVSGKLILTSKSDKLVTELTVEMKEVWQRGKGENKEVKEFELGESVVEKNFEIKAGETKEFNFDLEYNLIKSKNDKLQDKGGVIGKLGSVSKFMDGEKSTYSIEASASVKGTTFGPVAIHSVKIQ